MMSVGRPARTARRGGRFVRDTCSGRGRPQVLPGCTGAEEPPEADVVSFYSPLHSLLSVSLNNSIMAFHERRSVAS